MGKTAKTDDEKFMEGFGGDLGSRFRRAEQMGSGMSGGGQSKTSDADTELKVKQRQVQNARIRKNLRNTGYANR